MSGRGWDLPPRRLPELRRRIDRDLNSATGIGGTAAALAGGFGTIIPFAADADAAARVLCHQESARLRQARLYYATAEMTALACAAASSAPLQPVDLSTAPAPAGFIVFAQALTAYEHSLVTRPIFIHGLSWGPWSPHLAGPDGTVPERWYMHGKAGEDHPDGTYTYDDGLWVATPGAWAATKKATWVTIYAHSQAAAVLNQPGQIVAVPELTWDNESLLMNGGRLRAYEPNMDNHGGLLTVLYTCWQMMAQPARAGRAPLVDVSVSALRPTDARRARRQGYHHPDVRVVDVHRSLAVHLPPAAAPGATREYQCRWPVRPHRRSHCMNPRGHADGQCRHEEIIIPFQVRGPAGKPLKTTDTVNVWSHQPQ